MIRQPTKKSILSVNRSVHSYKKWHYRDVSLPNTGHHFHYPSQARFKTNEYWNISNLNGLEGRKLIKNYLKNVYTSTLWALVCLFKEQASPKFICNGVLGGYCPGLCQEEWWVDMQSLHSLLFILYEHILHKCTCVCGGKWLTKAGLRSISLVFHAKLYGHINWINGC